MMRRRLRHRGPGLEPDCAAISGPMPLSSLRPGDAGRVLDVEGEGAFRRRLLDMGFVKGTFVRVIKHAPLMNPIEYCIGGSHVTLRRDEATRVVVERVPAPERCRQRIHGPGRHRLHHGRGKGPRWWRRRR